MQLHKAPASDERKRVREIRNVFFLSEKNRTDKPRHIEWQTFGHFLSEPRERRQSIKVSLRAIVVDYVACSWNFLSIFCRLLLSSPRAFCSWRNEKRMNQSHRIVGHARDAQHHNTKHTNTHNMAQWGYTAFVRSNTVRIVEWEIHRARWYRPRSPIKWDERTKTKKMKNKTRSQNDLLCLTCVLAVVIVANAAAVCPPTLPSPPPTTHPHIHSLLSFSSRTMLWSFDCRRRRRCLYINACNILLLLCCLFHFHSHFVHWAPVQFIAGSRESTHTRNERTKEKKTNSKTSKRKRNRIEMLCCCCCDSTEIYVSACDDFTCTMECPRSLWTIILVSDNRLVSMLWYRMADRHLYR